MLSVDMLILFSASSVFGSVWHTPSPIVFAQIGQNVSLLVKATGRHSSFTWYRQKHSGQIELVCSGKMCNNKSRHTAGMSDSSGKVFLTIVNTSVTDSGSYFVASSLSKIYAFRDASYLNLAVTDHIPVIRLFHGSGSGKTHAFQCEITPAGAGWSSPYWRVKENGQLREMKGVGGGGIDADGRFARWSMVTLGSEKSLSVTCLGRHNHTGVMIQTDTVDMPKDASLCLLITAPLACLLLLLTLVLAVLSAWRICKHRRSITNG